jgi:NAD(P)-dependent dehydrogenase (short-subunit alcohol dehydrogenase family)
MAQAGFDIAVVDVERDDDAEETIAGIVARGRRAEFLSHDIAQIEHREAFVERAWACFGTVDCLVNNAGVTVKARGDLLDVTPESFDRVMGINLRGTFFLTQAVARRMILEDRAASGPFRSIVTISSANAFLVGPDRPEYCFSKASLSMMTKMYALRLGLHGIATYDVRPGIIRTAMTHPVAEKYERWIGEGLTPIARWGEPEDVGRAVATLALGLVPFSTGDSYHVDGGLHIQKL